MDIAPLPTFEEFRDNFWRHEQEQDRALRMGIGPDGTQMRYRYVGPPMIPTPEATLLGLWLQMIEVRVQTRAAMWLAPKRDTDEFSRLHDTLYAAMHTAH